LNRFNTGRAPGTYISEATINIKGLEVSVPLSFNLEINGDQAKMTGSTTFTRKDLQLGQESDPDAEWVSEEIKVNVSLVAERN